MVKDDMELDAVLRQAQAGDSAACEQLLREARPALKAYVAPRLRGFLAARVDASDIVQETLLVADTRLADYLSARPVPFLYWLRELAMERVIDAYRLHINAQKRSVRREQPFGALLDDESMNVLAGRLAHQGSSPSQQAQRSELCARVRQAIQQMSDTDREVLVLRHLEHLSMREIALILGATESAIKVRHLRALQRLRDFLGEEL